MNLKFHLILSSIFLLLILGVASMSGDSGTQEGASASLSGDRFVQIQEASWGGNCADYIEAQRKKPASSDSDAEEPIPESFRRDNALRAVSSLCNNIEYCQFTVGPEALGFDPIRSCSKMMEVSYRCFMTDRLHWATAEDGEEMVIDCQKSAEN